MTEALEIPAQRLEMGEVVAPLDKAAKVFVCAGTAGTVHLCLCSSSEVPEHSRTALYIAPT